MNETELLFTGTFFFSPLFFPPFYSSFSLFSLFFFFFPGLILFFETTSYIFSPVKKTKLGIGYTRGVIKLSPSPPLPSPPSSISLGNYRTVRRSHIHFGYLPLLCVFLLKGLHKTCHNVIQGEISISSPGNNIPPSPPLYPSIHSYW